MTASPFEDARRIVIKTGSALIATQDGSPRTAWLSQLAGDIAAVRASGCDVLLVTSGAVALGRNRLVGGNPGKDQTDLSQKQAAAALGQPLLMNVLQAAFTPHGLTAAQALLTLEDTERRRRWLNARATLETLLGAGAVPVINENDTVATDEIRYGDNDRLAARVAQMISADRLILLSDIDGLYTADPRKDPSAEFVPCITALTPDIIAMGGAQNTDRGVGSGGMATKLAAAGIAFEAGCTTLITLGTRERPLSALTDGARATWIIPQATPKSARRTWLAGHLTPQGTLTVDAGAARALHAGSSLLAVGIVGVEGRFDKGAAVAIRDADGSMFAKGVSAYSATDIEKIMGQQSAAVESILGYRGRPSVIHRDDLVLAGA